MKRILSTSVCVAAMLSGIGNAQDADLEWGETEGPSSNSESDYGLFSHGYARLGFGSTDGAEFTAFQLGGSAAKYRLGNESDLYTEVSLGYRADLGNGSDFVTEVMGQAGGDSNALNFGSDLNAWNDVAQAYVGIEYLGSGAFSDSFLWAGRRYYRRRDIHMNDFYYENLSGDGVGIENVDLGAAAVSFAVFYFDRNDDGLDYSSKAVDLRVHDIALGGSWLGEIGLAYIDGTGEDHTGDDGYSLRLHAEAGDLGWGEWKNAIMYGRGAGIDFDSRGNTSAGSDDSRIRLVSHALIKTSEDLETQATAIWQRTDIGGESETWASAGVRPSYNFTRDFGLAVELGYDHVTSESDGSGSLSKATIAPFYSFGNKGYYARPQLRAFATFANWSDEGAITNQDAFGNDTSGTSYGLQLEHWW